MEEIYKEIENFPDYAISNLGKVKRLTTSRNYSAGYILTPHLAYDGYVTIQLMNKGKRHKFYLHRLVLLTFVGPPPTIYHQASHQDGNKINNVLDNLKWETPKENYSKRILHGTDMRGEFGPGAKLTEDQVMEIRRRYAEHRNNKKNKRATRGFRVKIAKEFGVSPINIHQIIAGKSWRNLL